MYLYRFIYIQIYTYLGSSQLLLRGSLLANQFCIPTSSVPKQLNFKEFLSPEDNS